MDLSGGGGGGGAQAGSELRDIETEHIGFRTASSEDRVQLLPSAWPADNLPPTTSSLLSVAPRKGLIAAAGPEAVVVATTDSLRHTFLHEAASQGVKSFTPQATIQLQRASQVSFSSDESCLVVAAEQGGGLAVYDTNALANGNTTTAFELATEGESVRQLVPNPNPASDLSGFFGVVTTNGKLLLADLKERKLVAASNGSSILHDNVSCACWSRLGKQIIAGLADGTAAQIDRQGAIKARIPQPPQLETLKDPSSTALPITSIFWLETDDFLIIHTPINPPDAGANDDSLYHLAHRNKQNQSWTFSTLTDPCFSYLDRKPAHHFIQRLREWGNLTELLVVSNTASSDIGMFTRSKVPLNPDDPLTDTWAETKASDQRRAAMPMINNADTTPIGMAIDLSAKEKITQPIPNDDMIDESPVPLPALYVLNNEGQLSMWWIIYNEAVRQSITYPDMIVAGGPRSLGEQKPQQPQAQSAASSMPPPSTTSPFGGTFGATSKTPSQPPAFGQTSSTPSQTSTFGQPTSTPSQTSAFGRPSSASSQTPAFGQPSSMTPAQKPAFGQSSFGTPSTPAFGGTSTMGNRQSPWAGASSIATGAAGGSAFGKPAFGQTSSFGQPSGAGGSKTSVWGTPQSSTPQQTPSASGGGVFGGNASNQSPFLNLGGKPASSSSGFAAFGGGNNTASPFASAARPSLSAEPSGSTVSFGNNTSFGSSSTNFGVQSQPSYFGSPTPSAASGTFGKPSVPASREESMGDDHTSATASTAKPPTQNENKSPFGLGSGGFKLGSTFKGDGSAKDDLPKPSNPGAGLFGSNFGNALGEASKTSSNSEGTGGLFGRSTPAQPAIKKEPGTEEEPKLSEIPAVAPKQEEKKASPPPSDDAPLPPDPTTWKPKPGAQPAPVPPGFEGLMGKSKTKEEQPSEADPIKPEDQGPDESLAGSPPIDLGKETFSEGVKSDAEPEGPPDDGDWSDEEDEGDEEDGEGEEGSEDEEDEGDEEDEESGGEEGARKVDDQAGLSAFQARITPASPKRKDAQPTDSTTPATEKKVSYTPATERKESYTPAGMPQAPIMFAPPQRKGPESPRSPSPQRSTTSPLRPMPSFGSQQQSRPPPQPAGSRQSSSSQMFRPSQSRTTSQASAQPSQRIAVPAAQLAQSQQRPTSSPKPAEPEPGELEDEEADRIKAILAAPLEPTQDVPAFLAHQDYVASADDKTGLLGQMERVYRDINSMIDTLGLNARSMKEFIEGSLHGSGDEPKNRLDLENEEDWVLGEVNELADIVDGVERQLEDGRLTDVRGAIGTLREEESGVSKLRTKSADVRKHVMARKDPEQLAQQHAAPLPMEAQTMQSELRQEVSSVQKLLAKAEEQLSILRAELASIPSAQGTDGRSGSGVPTVEAVEKTIRKMTQMVMQKSGDIDVLESQIRKLGGPGALKPAGNYEDELIAGMKATRLSRSPSAGLRSSQLRASAYGSPAAARRGTPGRGTPGRGTPGMRSFMDVGVEEVEAFRVKREARGKVLEALRGKVESRGVRVLRVEVE
ncbi:uncharacterized protein LTR77_002929 [Saxophila tyrrhenica]|uniref:Nucleoporin Nup159/Nup146 N-terminal domain-containing protein n=1 Tax=Saxophila tyrrhenica TaxID=1690608 RepID=A0AAV9PGC6_9PEZI|nr:hypothetical protein LTR77_002929 [Saxophila tyrrhenica]